MILFFHNDLGEMKTFILFSPDYLVLVGSTCHTTWNVIVIASCFLSLFYKQH